MILSLYAFGAGDVNEVGPFSSLFKASRAEKANVDEMNEVPLFMPDPAIHAIFPISARSQLAWRSRVTQLLLAGLQPRWRDFEALLLRPTWKMKHTLTLSLPPGQIRCVSEPLLSAEGCHIADPVPRTLYTRVVAITARQWRTKLVPMPCFL